MSSTNYAQNILELTFDFLFILNIHKLLINRTVIVSWVFCMGLVLTQFYVTIRNKVWVFKCFLILIESLRVGVNY